MLILNNFLVLYCTNFKNFKVINDNISSLNNSHFVVNEDDDLK